MSPFTSSSSILKVADAVILPPGISISVFFRLIALSRRCNWNFALPRLSSPESTLSTLRLRLKLIFDVRMKSANNCEGISRDPSLIICLVVLGVVLSGFCILAISREKSFSWSWWLLRFIVQRGLSEAVSMTIDVWKCESPIDALADLRMNPFLLATSFPDRLKLLKGGNSASSIGFSFSRSFPFTVISNWSCLV